MYSLKAFLQKTPIQITGAVMGIVNLFVIAGWWVIDAKTVSGLNVALIGCLGLFVVNSTSNNAKLAELHAATLESIDLGKNLAQNSAAPTWTWGPSAGTATYNISTPSNVAEGGLLPPIGEAAKPVGPVATPAKKTPAKRKAPAKKVAAKKAPAKKRSPRR